MDTEMSEKSYLQQLYTMTNGDMEAQVSMYEVGINLGMDKTEAGTLAEDLMVQGLLELRNLAGAISLTKEGLKYIGMEVPGKLSAAATETLSSGAVVTSGDLRVIQEICAKIRLAIEQSTGEFTHIETLVFDLKTIDVQLLSPSPKLAILKATLQSCEDSLRALQAHSAADAVSSVLK